MPHYPEMTSALLHQKFPSVIASTMLDYFLADSRDAYTIAKMGEYETCMQILVEGREFTTKKHGEYITEMLYGACMGGHLEAIISLINIERDKEVIPILFNIACDLLHYDIANYFLSLGLINPILQLKVAKHYEYDRMKQVLSAYIAHF